MKTDMESAAADHATALAGVRTTQGFQALEEESKRARKEATRLSTELTAERSGVSREGGTVGQHLPRGDEEAPSATLRPG